MSRKAKHKEKEGGEMAISTGTLRKKFNESLEKRILCRNSLLMTLAAMKGDSAYSNGDRAKVAKVLIDNGCTKEDILKIVPQIEKNYTPTDVQVDKILEVISGKYSYNRDYIANKFLRTVNQKDLGITESKKRWERDGAALRQYIYENGLVEELLEEIGCECIHYHANKGYWSCTNPDGDNPSSVNVTNNPYLGVKNYTREDDFDDRADIITLVRYARGRKCSYYEAYDYICDVLEIENHRLSGARKAENGRNKKLREDSHPKVNKEEQSKLSEHVLLKFIQVVPPQWYIEGISPQSADKFGICINPDKDNGAIIIPIRDYQSGKLIALSARTTIDENVRKERRIAKYRTTPKYKKHLNIYGLYENKNDILEKGYVVVYEAEKSVLKRDSVGDSTGVALQGHELSEEQAEILLSLNVDIVISMDADVSIKDIWKMCEKLYQRNGRNIYYTIDIHGLLGEKDAVADLKNEEYDLIFSEKVLYDKISHERFLSW